MDIGNYSDYDKLLNRALREILKHENFPRFLSWMQKEIGFSPQLSLVSPSSDHLRPLATNLALAIWNGTPLPGNDFHPSPIPIPKRNQPCACGSGKKHKRCCLVGDLELPEINQDAIWPILLEILPQKLLRRALKEGPLPLSARVSYCADILELGDSNRVIQLLERYYTADTHPDNEEYAAYGLNLLFEAYSDMGQERKKIELIEHICTVVPPSALRSEALQRLSSIQADAGDFDAAFETLTQARKDTPDSLEIGLLEIHLLLFKGDYALARQRALFVAKQMRRHDSLFGDESEAPSMLAFLEAVIEEPEAAAAILYETRSNLDTELSSFLTDQKNRPIPCYTFSQEKGLSAMMDENTKSERPSYIATFPSKQLKLETIWMDICPIEPLFGANMVPFTDDDPWNEAELLEWKQFILDHPVALDSIVIIDDLLTIASLHPAWGQQQMMSTIFEPLLQRGMGIVSKNLKALPKHACLPWIASENRPFLRTLLRAFIDAQFSENHTLANNIALQLLHINPADNHGLREYVINYHLRLGDNSQALELAKNYPDDMLPAIIYGKILALYRLGQKDEALKAAAIAKERSHRIASWLIAPQKKDPQELTDFGIIAGSRQEAWEYRVAMRDEWKKTRGALTWLKKI